MLFNREAVCKCVNGDGISKQNGQDLQHSPFYAFIFLLSLSHRPLPVSQDWLMKFGYLPPPDPVTGQLQTQEELTKAITAMQRFGGLEATGVLGQWVPGPSVPAVAEEGRLALLCSWVVARV